jgi:hypothetical protein
VNNYRVCLVDENLNQITGWRFLDSDGFVEWEPGEVYPHRYGTTIESYLIHDTHTDSLGVCWTDLIMQVKVGDRVELRVRPQTRRRYTDDDG